MWLILQQEKPEDYVIATGEIHSVREFVEKAFKEAGIVISWEGSGVGEVGKESHTGKTLIKIDPRYFRPTEVDFLLGDPSKARSKLGWASTVTFAELVRIMVREDLKIAERDKVCQTEGFQTFNGFESEVNCEVSGVRSEEETP